MSELRLARHLMNTPVRDALESHDIYDPASFDEGDEASVDLAMLTVDDLMMVTDERMTSGGWSGERPWAPWEVIL